MHLCTMNYAKLCKKLCIMEKFFIKKLLKNKTNG